MAITIDIFCSCFWHIHICKRCNQITTQQSWDLSRLSSVYNILSAAGCHFYLFWHVYHRCVHTIPHLESNKWTVVLPPPTHAPFVRSQLQQHTCKYLIMTTADSLRSQIAVLPLRLFLTSTSRSLATAIRSKTRRSHPITKHNSSTVIYNISNPQLGLCIDFSGYIIQFDNGSG